LFVSVVHIIQSKR